MSDCLYSFFVVASDSLEPKADPARVGSPDPASVPEGVLKCEAP